MLWTVIDRSPFCFFLHRSVWSLPWGRSVPSVSRPWQTNKRVGLCCPGNKHHPQPVSCILIGSATKASAFTDNLNHSIVISLNMIFNLCPPRPLSHLVSPSHRRRGPLPERWGFVWWRSTLYKTFWKKKKDDELLLPAYFIFFCLQRVLPLTFLNVLITTGFSFSMIIFYILKYSRF